VLTYCLPDKHLAPAGLLIIDCYFFGLPTTPP
jgi:hypothetical protein